MKIVDSMAISGRRRSTYSLEFKRGIVAKCREPGISVVRVALVHGINANVVRRWLREAEHATHPVPIPSFIPVTFAPAELPTALPVPPASTEIRVELERGGSRVVVNWPLAAAGECAAFLRAWLP